ncbi:hypothetical protein ES704_02012 [subsurface metagenome]|jgi:hypothetical protein
MKLKELVEITQKLKKRPLPGRKLYIWIGRIEKLRAAIPKDILQEIDILNLDLQPNTSDDSRVGKEIKKKLNSELNALATNLKKQQILTVLNSSLLARYKVSLTPFYEYYLKDRTLVILHLPLTSYSEELPKYVEFKPESSLKYFEGILPEEHKQNIVKEE